MCFVSNPYFPVDTARPLRSETGIRIIIPMTRITLIQGLDAFTNLSLKFCVRISNTYKLILSMVNTLTYFVSRQC